MKQFFCDPQSPSWGDLEVKATKNLITFHAQEMPQACMPRRAKVGFRINEQKASAILFVEKGVAYVGKSQTIAKWFLSGSLEFPNFEELKKWVFTELKYYFFDEEMIECGSIHGIPMMLSSKQIPSGTPDERRVDVSQVVIVYGRNQGLNVRKIDPTVIDAILSCTDKVANGDCFAPFNEVLSGPFALAAALGMTDVDVKGTPRILCVPATES